MTATTLRTDHAAASANLPMYYRVREVLRITGLSRPTLYRRIAAKRFPAPVHLGGRACGWHSVALQSWISDPEGYCTLAAEKTPT